jgi:arylesterase/paraoxonase
MKRYVKVIIAVVAVVLLLILFVLKTMRDAGQFKTIASHCDCTCTQVTGLVGPEDIEVDPDLKIAFVSCDDRRAVRRGEKVQGAIYAYALEKPQPLTNLTPNLPFDFHPHGISLYRSSDGERRLFVVSHRADGHYIEIFVLRGMMLNHLESISGQTMTNPNDLVAVGPREFYVTNMQGATSNFGQNLEKYLQLAWAYVLYYDGKDFRKAAEDLAYPNGITVSRDGKTVYVASTIKHIIKVYDRDEASGALQYRDEIDLDTGVDNLDIDRDGNIWVACHPKLLTYVKHSGDPSVLSPSQVIKVIPKEEGYDIQEVYLNSGEELSASSVAVLYKDRMLIGAVFGDKILDCKLKK